jgi:hypothetical protein
LEGAVRRYVLVRLRVNGIHDMESRVITDRVRMRCLMEMEWKEDRKKERRVREDDEG